ncbi:hypothetical protein [Azospirillum sp. sgz301742]
MTQEKSVVIEDTLSSEAPRRKPWLAPQIEDVSVAMTAKVTSTLEYGTGKNGS